MKRQVTHFAQSGGYAHLAQSFFVTVFQDASVQSRDEKSHGVQTCGHPIGKGSCFAAADGRASGLRVQLVLRFTNCNRAMVWKNGEWLLVKEALVKVSTKNQITNIKELKYEQAMWNPHPKQQHCPRD